MAGFLQCASSPYAENILPNAETCGPMPPGQAGPYASAPLPSAALQRGCCRRLSRHSCRQDRPPPACKQRAGRGQDLASARPRGHHSRASNEQGADGTGLGTYLVRLIARVHDGEAPLTTSSDKVTVSVELPRPPRRCAPTVAPGTVATPGSGEFRCLRHGPRNPTGPAAHASDAAMGGGQAGTGGGQTGGLPAGVNPRYSS